MKYLLGFAGLGLTAYLALRPNPLRDALTDLIAALTDFIGRM